MRTLACAMGHAIDDRDWTFPIRFARFRRAPPQVGPARVRTFETRHQPEAHPQGYRVDLGGRTIAYSGDTGWFPELPRLFAGADLFICECTLHRETLDFHLNLETVEAHQQDFDCGRLLLTHLGEEMVEMRGRCSIETADDGLAVKL